MGRLTAVCRVHMLHPDTGSVGVTAIDKRPVDGPVRVRSTGLYGDVQADRVNHGGLDKAVYAYADEAAARWAAELGRDIDPGAFGENLRTAGVDVDEAVIGELWRVGSQVELEVRMPRTPCMTFGRWQREERWVKRFSAEGMPGAYLRVRGTGEIAAGDAVEVISRPSHGVTVAGLFTRRDLGRGARALLDAERDGELVLADEVRGAVEAELSR